MNFISQLLGLGKGFRLGFRVCLRFLISSYIMSQLFELGSCCTCQKNCLSQSVLCWPFYTESFFFFYLLYIPNKSLYQAVFWILLISFSLFMLDLFVFLLFSYTLSILILEVGELLGISAKSQQKPGISTCCLPS